MGGSRLRLIISIIALVLGLLITIGAVFGIAIGSQSMKFFVGIVVIIGLIIAGTGGLTVWNILRIDDI